jgi:hypothetical protein
MVAKAKNQYENENQKFAYEGESSRDQTQKDEESSQGV